jgi:hypothetical protein
MSGIYGWLRFVLTVDHWNEYSTLGVQPGIWYLALTGFLAGLVYTPAGVTALLPGTIWKRVTLFLLVTGLTLHWIDRICFARSVEAQTSLPFTLTAVTLLTAAAACLLFGNSIRSLIAHGK